MRTGAVLTALVLTAALSACGGDDTSDDVTALQDRIAELEAATSTEPSAEPSAEPAVEAEPVATQAAAAEPTPQIVSFVMPNLVGQNLQVAQNTVQEFGVFFSVSHDMLGQRSQLLDSNWQVCTQKPAAGTKIEGPAEQFEGTIDFGAVKLTETCP